MTPGIGHFQRVLADLVVRTRGPKQIWPESNSETPEASLPP